MARDWQINGEAMIYVRGPAGSTIGTLQELGLAQDPIRIRPTFKHQDLTVDAWGGEVPAEEQVNLAEVAISMTLGHFDPEILEECARLSMGGAPAVGQLARAGARMGGNVAQFAAGNNYIGLGISSPVSSKPWRFHFCRLTDPPYDWPLGTQKSYVAINWRCIPYTRDPYGGGTGAQGFVLFDHQNPLTTW